MWVFLCSLAVPNSGIVLWFQQFCAMFLKRVYNTMRFWQAVFSQLILPLLFVLFALILVKTLPNVNENDPSRALNVDNSGLDSSNRFLFYAEFGPDPNAVFDFEVRASHQSHIWCSLFVLFSPSFSTFHTSPLNMDALPHPSMGLSPLAPPLPCIHFLHLIHYHIL